ncbi:uncharacterized protein [Excalfactoria chinensis]|uniref:uncharacterized protein n=1 Tax=Excalfactoria chinensis TaxID=46218 RepID=UPI003B3B57B4
MPSSCAPHRAGTHRFPCSAAADTKPHPPLSPLLTGAASPPWFHRTARGHVRVTGKAQGKRPLQAAAAPGAAAPPAKEPAVAGRGPSAPRPPRIGPALRARLWCGAARRAVPPRVPPRSSASTVGTEWPRRARHGQGVSQQRARMGGGPGSGRVRAGFGPSLLRVRAEPERAAAGPIAGPASPRRRCACPTRLREDKATRAAAPGSAGGHILQQLDGVRSVTGFQVNTRESVSSSISMFYGESY